MKKVLVCMITFFILSFPIAVSANPFSLLLLGIEGVKALSGGDSATDGVENSVIDGVQKYIMSGMEKIGHPLTFGSLYDAKKINDSMVLTYTGTIDDAPMLFSIIITDISNPDKIAVINRITTWDDTAEYKSHSNSTYALWEYYAKEGIHLGPVPTHKKEATSAASQEYAEK